MLSLFRLLFLGFLGFSGGGLIASTLGGGLASGLVETRRIALAHLAEGSLSLAQPQFEALVAAIPAERWEGIEARFYARYCELAGSLRREGFSPWQVLPETPWGESRGELEALAAQLRAIAPEPEIWEHAWRRLGEVQTGHRWAPEGRYRLGAYRDLFTAWAESTDLERARRNYLDLVWELGHRRELRHDQLRLLRPMVENAAQLAQTPAEVQRFSWLWAQFLGRFQERPADRTRQGAALRRAIEAEVPDEQAWRVRALFDFGQWAEHSGRDYFDEDGQLRFSPDRAAAVSAYQRLMILAGEHLAPDLVVRARERLAVIRREELAVLVPTQFRPETEPHLLVRWRNLETPEVRVWRLSPAAFVAGAMDQWAGVETSLLEEVAEVTLQAQPSEPFESVQERIRISTPLTPGAYLVEARAGERVARELCLVNDLALVLHGGEGDWVAFAADPTTGAPIADVTLEQVSRWQLRAEEEAAPVTRVSATTDRDGLAKFPLEGGRGTLEQRTLALHPERGATLLVSTEHLYRAGGEQSLVVYPMTDRSLYRPGETVRVKVWARLSDGTAWQLPPAGSELRYELSSYSGTDSLEGTVVLSEEGTAVLEFPLPAEASMGTYSLGSTVVLKGGEQEWSTWSSELFQVEAFRTPEIEASVHFEPSPVGARLVGDTIEGSLEVRYYAGGVIEGAEVEWILRRQSFSPARRFFGGDLSWGSPMEWNGGGGGAEIERRTLETDSRGRADFSFTTTDDGESSWIYTVEARVRDLSRRETVATAEVTVARQSHFASLSLEHRVIAPGDRATLSVVVEDANGEPVATTGRVRVTRERWREIYIHRRRGDEISGEAFRGLPDRSLLSAARSDYDLKEANFVTEEVLVSDLSTEANGRASFVFEPSTVGYYSFAWVSRGRRGQPVLADVPLWVTDSATTEIGYRPGGVEIISDRGPHSLGEPIPVLLTAAEAGRTILLSLAGEKRTETRVVRLEGTSKLIFITPTEAHQPNFWALATMVSEESIYRHTFEWEIPWKEPFLQLTIAPDADGYQPRETASLRVTVRDAVGGPVQTRLALSVNDAALYSLVPRFRESPADVFYGVTHRNRLTLRSSLGWRPYFDPIAVEPGAEGKAEGDDAVFQVSPFEVNVGDQYGFASVNTLSGMRMAAAMDVAAAPLTRAGGNTPATPAFTRSDFRPTALWLADVETDANGEARVEVTFPDNLTAWRIEGVVVTPETRVAENQVETTTRLPLIARLQHPRFLTQRDEVTLTGTFQNNSESEETVFGRLDVGPEVTLRDPVEQSVVVPAGGVGRIDWKARADTVGALQLVLTGATEREGDAVEQSLPVVLHGEPLRERVAGRTNGGSVALTLSRAGTDAGAEFHLTATSTLATELFGALPYLIDFPYGCTEQTLSRFLPALAVRGAVRDLGYPMEAVDAAIFSELSPEAWGDRTDLSAVLDEVVADGIARLTRSQLENGSFPWIEGGQSDAYMTAYAVYALTMAEDLGVALGNLNLAAARAWLERSMIEVEAAPALRAWMLHALAVRHRASGLGRPTRLEARAFLRLIEERATLRPSGLALLALTAKYFGFEEDAELLVRNLATDARRGQALLTTARDAEGAALALPTAHWGRSSGYFAWDEGAVETTAFVIKALLLVAPEEPSIEASVTWLTRQRTGTAWGNTRATAITVLALTNFLETHDTRHRAPQWELTLNGAPLEFTAPPETGGWSSALKLSFPATAFEGETAELRVARTDAEAPFYFTLDREWMATEDPIPAASSELVLSRRYEHLAPTPTLLRGVREEQRPLGEGDPVGSGDRVEVILTLESPRDLRHVLLEDRKPGGFETVQLLSGERSWLEPVSATGERVNDGSRRRVPASEELRDRTVGYLIEYLPAGRWELRYRLRAEAPGVFHTLPARAEAMYLPGVAASSAEQLLEVQDR